MWTGSELEEKKQYRKEASVLSFNQIKCLLREGWTIPYIPQM